MPNPKPIANEEKCDCKEMSCKEGCMMRHTHKGFFCEKCEPVTNEENNGIEIKEEKYKSLSFEEFKERLYKKDPTIKWVSKLVDEEVKEALLHQRQELEAKLNERLPKETSLCSIHREPTNACPICSRSIQTNIGIKMCKEIINQVLKEE